ncbi:hypothetical protein [Streptomyces sp. N502]|uniref:hypothetical protein n=1 Tax=Streptomyces sp. N502 TaxID=2730916 RepID=UPI001487F59F|nr:hypothetical protein [Streptomyces sp. N502]
MAQNSWPSPNYNARNVTDAEYEKLASRFSDDGVYGDPNDTAVVSAGVGLSADVRAGVYASVRGHAWYSGTTTVNLPVSANASGSTRVDWVVLRLDRATWDVRATLREGTPGAGAPALVQDTGSTGVYEIPLAQVTILNGASVVSVTRVEQYVGTRLRPCTSLSRPAMPRRGEVGYELDTGRLILYNGSAWITIYSDSGVINCTSALSSWNATITPVIWERNGNVHMRLGEFQRVGSNFSAASDSRLPVLIPAGYRPSHHIYAVSYLTGTRIGRCTVYSANNARAGQVWLTQHPGISTNDIVMPNSVSWVV